MSFISAVFVGFLLITATVYFLVPARSQWIVLLSASYIFYFAAGMELAIFLLCTTVIVFVAGRRIGKCNQEYRDRIKCTTDFSKGKKKRLKESYNKRKKRIVVLMLLINFGILKSLW